MALVEEVRQELERKREHGGKAAFRKWLDTSNIHVLSMDVGSSASNTFAQLLNPASSKDRGEQASIALAAFDDTLTFVTHDHIAQQLALRELWRPGERVLSLPVFLRRLMEQKALEDSVVLDDIVSHAMKPPPTWWASWRAGLASRRN